MRWCKGQNIVLCLFEFSSFFVFRNPFFVVKNCHILCYGEFIGRYVEFGLYYYYYYSFGVSSLLKTFAECEEARVIF